MNTLDVYDYLIETNEITSDVVNMAVHQYVYKGRVMGFRGISEKVKEKAKKIIYVSLETTKILLKYVVKVAIDIALPVVAKELAELGIDIIVEYLSKCLKKDKYKEYRKAKHELFDKIGDETKALLDKLLNKGCKIMNKQNKKLDEELNLLVKDEF